MSTNGDGTTGDTSPGDGAVPKLTIGQRVLASLPNLQRQVPAPAPERPARKTAAAGIDESAGPALTADEVLAPGTDAPPPSAGRRPAAAPRQRGAPSGMTAAELAHIIKRIDDRERSIALGSAVLGVAVGIALTVAEVHTNPAVHVKGHTSTGFIVFEGGVRDCCWLPSSPWPLGIVVAPSSASPFCSLGTSMGGLFALPFWAVGVWLIFRALKWQKELAAMTGQTRAPSAPGADGTGWPGDATPPRPAARPGRNG